MSATPLSHRIGERFGYLVVIDSYRKEVNGRRRGMLRVRCDCGTEKDVLAHNVLQGRTKSCGCKTSGLKGWNFKHGLHDTRIYQIYQDMKGRCLNPNNRRYHRYGGRGISVCEEWLRDFMNFYNWAMQNGYRDDLTIERIDNDGNYTPDNCKWATMEEQLKNRDFSRMGRKSKSESQPAVS